MTGEEIYALASQNMDGETFESPEDAYRAMNVAYRKILADRIWKVLRKAYTLTAGTLSLAGITDLDVFIRLWSVEGTQSTDRYEMLRALWDDRYNLEKDYYLDLALNTIVLIGDTSDFTDKDKIVDYKYRPADIAEGTSPVFHEVGHPAIAYQMVMDFKESDENEAFYNQIKAKRDKSMADLIMWDASLEE